jgi:hypothetical protein
MTKLEYILDLRRRVEALEARAATEQSSATEPAPAPAADRPLWEVMSHAYYPIPPSGDKHDWADAIDAVATWLERRYLDRYPGAAELLRNEARRTREGA